MYVKYISLSAVVLNSRNWPGKLWLLSKCIQNSLVIVTTWKTSTTLTIPKFYSNIQKNRLEDELKNYIFSETRFSSACQPNHRKLPTTQTTCPIPSIVSEGKNYFRSHKPFLKWFLLCAIIVTCFAFFIKCELSIAS